MLYQTSIIGGTPVPLFFAPTSDATLALSPLELPDGKVLFFVYDSDSSSTGQVMVADTALSTIQFSGTGDLTEELSGTYATTVTLDSASLTTLTAQVNVSGGTATAGEDYTFTPLIVTFAPGEMSAPIPITLLEDEEDEPTETLILELSNIEGGVAGTPLTQTITIAETVYRQWIPFTSHQR